MEENIQYFEGIMLYYFKKGKNATEAPSKKNKCAVCGEGAGTDETCQKWFAKLRAGDQLKLMPSNQDIKNSHHYSTGETADLPKYPNK